MNLDKKILRVCAVVILCATLLRLLDKYELSADRSNVASAILFLGTGRVVYPEAPAAQAEETIATEPTPASLPFTREDAALLSVNDTAGVAPDVEQLLLQPLNWDLTGDAPGVLIFHTHATESYENTEGYTASSEFRTLDGQYNMLSVGAYVAQALTDRGIPVLHDQTLHDYPSYNGSYANSRQTLSRYLKEYPSICLALDLHRDAMSDSSGNQIGQTVTTEKGVAAKVMLVVGCSHTDWQENAAVALKLQAQLEKLCPGICRPMSLRKSRFNQDLLPGAVLIEVGAAGNTRQEALVAAEYVAEAIAALSKGTK